MKSFDKLYREKLQDNLTDKSEYESLCNTFTKYSDETENASLLKDEQKNNHKFFRDNNFKFNLEPRT